MSVLSLVMKELLDIDAEEFLNVRAYHSGGESSRQSGKDDGTSTSPTCSSDSCGSYSLGGSNSDDEQTTSTSSSSESSSAIIASKYVRKEHKISTLTRKGRQIPHFSKKLMYRGRDLLNLERNLQLHQWQLTSPLAGTYIYGANKKKSSFRFIEKCGLTEELMVSCNQCSFQEPIQV